VIFCCLFHHGPTHCSALRWVAVFADTDLHNVIRRGTILKDVHKRFIMYQLLKATKYIHSGNVIHRDQKVCDFILCEFDIQVTVHRDKFL